MTNKLFSVQDVGIEGLEQFLADNERRFGMSSAQFWERFSRSEMGDDPDYILWAGAYEIHQRLEMSKKGYSNA